MVEEPPPHLKFIFATTEPEKVIGTIRSRTHHYPFRLVPPGVLRDYLAEILAAEQIALEPAVLPLVVRAGAGSVRDSLSVMDQLLAGAGEDGVTLRGAPSALLGYTDAALLDEVVRTVRGRRRRRGVPGGRPGGRGRARPAPVRSPTCWSGCGTWSSWPQCRSRGPDRPAGHARRPARTG